jgi:hypothetical protein
MRPPRRAAILSELEKILSSQGLTASKRSQQFLSYVVKQTLEGHAELLKERSIGVEVFHRPAGYSTGDAGVVRVQAGDVGSVSTSSPESLSPNSAGWRPDPSGRQPAGTTAKGLRFPLSRQ